MRRMLHVAAAIIGTALLASCGPPPLLDTAQVEATVAAEASEQLGIEIASVTCPRDIRVQEGHAFACEVTDGDGNAAAASVVQDDDEGNVSWEVAAFRTGELADRVRGELAERTQIPDLAVECPEVVLQGGGNVFRCVARAPDAGTVTVVVTQTDDVGSVHWELEE